MPKVSLLSHTALLLVVSILFFPSAFGGITSDVGALAWVAAALGFVLLLTEVFSGSRWISMIAFGGAVVGLVLQCVHTAAPAASVWAWGVTWAAVVLWFAALASRARSNR